MKSFTVSRFVRHVSRGNFSIDIKAARFDLVNPGGHSLIRFGPDQEAVKIGDLLSKK